MMRSQHLSATPIFKASHRLHEFATSAGLAVEDQAVADLEVVRWRRYGKDRLYVNGSDGQRVGWVDLLTGERTVADGECEQAFIEAVNNWYGEAATPARFEDRSIDVSPPPDPVQEEASGAAPPAPPNWHDLATRVPGQAAREQAIRELATMKERTKVGTFLARAFDMKTDERAWRVGANGEETVGSRLEKLTKHGWHVLHAVPVGKRGSDIDHVVAGPGGVYTLNTKTHPGGRVWVGARAIQVNGQPVPYLRNSQHEGQRAERLLSEAAGFPVPVRPVLVFLTGSLIPNVTIKQRPDDVLVLDRMDIPGAFRRAPRRISPEQVDAIFHVARRCTTWTGSALCSCSDAG
jgi:hypothetical protein